MQHIWSHLFTHAVLVIHWLRLTPTHCLFNIGHGLLTRILYLGYTHPRIFFLIVTLLILSATGCICRLHSPSSSPTMALYFISNLLKSDEFVKSWSMPYLSSIIIDSYLKDLFNDMGFVLNMSGTINWLTVFNVLTLKVVMLKVILPFVNFYLGSVTDFPKSSAGAISVAEHPRPCCFT